MTRALPRELRKAAKVAASRGWDVRIARNGHVQWRHPDGKTMVTTSLTPSDQRGSKNALHDLRRAGLAI